MKRINFFPFLVGLGLCIAHTSLNAQQFMYRVSKQFTLTSVAEKTFLSVYNVAGNIRIEGYNGDKILIDAEEKITASTQKDVSAGKNEFKLGFDQKGDSIIVYISAPFDSRPHDDKNKNKEIKMGYHFLVNYVIKVPFAINLRLSTVNDGNILVRNVGGSLNINNINGGISIINAKGKTEARTINGDLTANYLATPPAASSYYTLNGKLEVIYPKGLSANIQAKTINGSIFTDFDNVETLPAKVMISKEKTGGQTQFKLDKNNELKIGSGGKLFKFETFNGNIYIKKKFDL